MISMKKRWNNNGFILAEITVAILLISIALLPICGMFIQSIQGDALAREYTIIANLAQKQLELLKLKSPNYWAELVLPCIIPWQDEAWLPPSKYIFTTKAVSVNSSLVKVTVTALWKERGNDCTLQFVTFYPAL